MNQDSPLYELSNYRTAERKYSHNLGLLVIECSQRGGLFACWSVSRVADGALYNPKTKTFGKRIYTPAGDHLRVAKAKGLAAA